MQLIHTRIGKQGIKPSGIQHFFKIAHGVIGIHLFITFGIGFLCPLSHEVINKLCGHILLGSVAWHITADEIVVAKRHGDIGIRITANPAR
ncbi:MAG: hypothetical protein R2941_02085 [Desulfobacterales bacterium]